MYLSLPELQSDLSLAELTKVFGSLGTNNHLLFPVKRSSSASGISLRTFTRFPYHFFQPTRLNLNPETIFLG